MLEKNKQQYNYPNLTLTKAFKKVNNNVIKLAGTNYLTNLIHIKTRIREKKINEQLEDRRKTKTENNFGDVKESLKVSHLNLDEFKFHKILGENRIKSSKPIITHIGIQNFLKKGDLIQKFVINSISTEESQLKSEIFHTQIPILESNNLTKPSSYYPTPQNKDGVKFFFISRKNLEKLDRIPRESPETNEKSKKVCLKKVFEKKINLSLNKKKLPLSKMKELKLELMVDEKKNRKNLDELAKKRIQSNEDLKYLSSILNKEKRKKHFLEGN
jgi:hypothetical protein